MKTLITAMALCATAALLPLQAQDTVTSVNAVGMVRLEVPAGGRFFLARLDFIPNETGTTTVSDLLGTELPSGTTVFVWDRDEQNWNLAATLSTNFLGETLWSNGQTPIALGDAFFIRSAVNTTEPTTIVISGEVPGANNLVFDENSDEYQAVMDNFYGFVGFPFPVEITPSEFAQSNFALSLPVGATIFTWDTSLNSGDGGYNLAATKSVNFLGETVWSQLPHIKPGHGFWLSFQSGPPPILPIAKPYQWP